MKKTPLASVVINNYNYDCFLGEAIDSALSQSYPNVEVVVVDDGSTDNSAQIIQEYGNRITSVLKSNGGQASAFNAGVEASKGELLFFLDADDIFCKNKIQSIIDLSSWIDFDSPLMIFHSLEAVDQSSSALGFLITENIPHKLLSTQSVLDVGFGKLTLVSIPESAYQYASKYRYIPYLASPTSGLVLTRSLIKNLFPIPQDGILTCADDFIVKPSTLLGSIYQLDRPLAKYRIHGKNWWYGSSKPRTKQFLLELDIFLNQKLIDNKKKSVFSHFDSMVSRDYYRDHFNYQKCQPELITLAWKTVLFWLDFRTFRFFLATHLIIIKSSLICFSKNSNDQAS